MSRLPRCIQLRRLFSSASFVGCADITVEAATDRLEAVRQGDLFVARIGSSVDRHAFAAEAVERGAGAVLCQRPLTDVRAPQCIVPNVAEAYGRLCHALHGFPGRQIPVVGVTGTDGKTTTTWLLRSILSQPRSGRPGRAVALSGSIDVDDGISLRPAQLTTPGPMELAEWLGRSSANGVSAAVLELSSHALDQDRAAGIRLDAAVVTGLGRDHLDYHADHAAYTAAKARIVHATKSGGRVVLGASAADPIVAKVDPGGRQVIVFGDHPNSTASVVVNEETTKGLKLTLRFGVDAIEVESSLIGEHNANNILAAALAASHFGATPEAIRNGVAAVTTVPGRMESIETDGPFDLFVDYAHTPDAIATVTALGQRIAKERVIVVSGAGGERDQEKRALMGRALGQADRIILTSDNPRNEDAREICRAMCCGLEGDACVSTIIDRRDAIAAAVDEASAGDVVLVLGKGHEVTQTIGDDRLPFDDRVVCREVLDRLSVAV